MMSADMARTKPPSEPPRETSAKADEGQREVKYSDLFANDPEVKLDRGRQIGPPYASWASALVMAAWWGCTVMIWAIGASRKNSRTVVRG
jgi:hypothetical protein